MVHYLAVGIGGFVGSILRYWLTGAAYRWWGSTFPVGTLIVNLLGCLAIGGVMYVVDHRQWFSGEMRALIVPGLLGGFTTFSAFSYESFTLLRQNQPLLAVANAGGSVFLGLAAVAVGWIATKSLV